MSEGKHNLGSYKTVNKNGQKWKLLTKSFCANTVDSVVNVCHKYIPWEYIFACNDCTKCVFIV